MLELFYQRLYAQNERVMKFGLEGINTALEDSGLKPSYRHVLVGGTNGKGQVAKILSVFCHRQGKRVGFFSSPHLVDFRERIVVEGEMIQEDRLFEIGCRFLARYGGGLGVDLERYCLDRGMDFGVHAEGYSGRSLSYFELCLMIALQYFQDCGVEYGIFEVGLGGRLDACNALDPEISIVSSISKDHVQWLGDSIEAIAVEKSGIFRAGRDVVIGGYQGIEVLKQEAQKRGCGRCFVFCEDFSWKRESGLLFFEGMGEKIGLYGGEEFVDFQCDNAVVAVCAGLLIAGKDEELSDEGVINIMNHVLEGSLWVGRFMRFREGVESIFGCGEIILDGAHNVAGAKALCEGVGKILGGRRCIFLVNSCEDKDVEGIWECYMGLVRSEDVIICGVSGHERLFGIDGYCKRVGIDACQGVRDVREGLAYCGRLAGVDGVVVVSGSLYLVGEALSVIRERLMGICGGS